LLPPDLIAGRCRDFLQKARASRDAMPEQWGKTQHGRANALARLGQLFADASALRQAVAGFDEALTVFTRKDMPREWAATQNNRAAALNELGDLSGDAAVLRGAVAGFDAALTVYSRDATPAGWAMTRSRRGLQRREHRSPRHERADRRERIAVNGADIDRAACVREPGSETNQNARSIDHLRWW
jgi:hypothetical protein